MFYLDFNFPWRCDMKADYHMMREVVYLYLAFVLRKSNDKKQNKRTDANIKVRHHVYISKQPSLVMVDAFWYGSESVSILPCIAHFFCFLAYPKKKKKICMTVSIQTGTKE
uniref:Uncharacterized protein n=1 Tax=Nelumbo nucifera TaxID=4432 RepID=A0A822XNJ6_NELNU|nr:TPA_asm: hypothetical protein HUJ06_024647 [Nelumbo nucifera]